MTTAIQKPSRRTSEGDTYTPAVRWSLALVGATDGGANIMGSLTERAGAVLRFAFTRQDLAIDLESIHLRQMRTREAMDATDKANILAQIRAALPTAALRRAREAAETLSNSAALTLEEQELALRVQRYKLEKRPADEIAAAEQALAAIKKAAKDFEIKVRAARDELTGMLAQRKRKAEEIALRCLTQPVERDRARRAEILEQLKTDNAELLTELGEIELRLSMATRREDGAATLANEALTILETQSDA